MNYRAMGNATAFPRGDFSRSPLDDLDVGAVAPTAEVLTRHRAGTVTDRPDPRRNPAPVPTEDQVQGWNTYRRWRTRSDAAAPTWPQNGLTEEEQYAPIWAGGTSQNGGAVGTSDPAVPEDHRGYNARRGEQSPEAGVNPGVADAYGGGAPGGGGVGRAKQTNDVAAHTAASYALGRVDPRRYEAGLGNPDTPDWLEPMEHAQENMMDVPYAADAQLAYEKPREWFLMGRPAKRPPLWLYMRPFDQAIAHHMTGEKVYPSSPPTFGQHVDATPHASLPIQTEQGTEAPPAMASHGPSFAAPGWGTVNPSGVTRNSWRLQPEPWDTELINTGP